MTEETQCAQRSAQSEFPLVGKIRRGQKHSRRIVLSGEAMWGAAPAGEFIKIPTGKGCYGLFTREELEAARVTEGFMFSALLWTEAHARGKRERRTARSAKRSRHAPSAKRKAKDAA
jgi:hypothetical protein